MTGGLIRCVRCNVYTKLQPETACVLWTVGGRDLPCSIEFAKCSLEEKLIVSLNDKHEGIKDFRGSKSSVIG